MKLPKLYQRAQNNKVNTLVVEVERNKYRTITGFEDGAKTTSKWKECYEKSYCTAEEQAVKEATAFHRKKKEHGYFEDINDIDKSTLFNPMLAAKWEDKKAKVQYPVFTQPKLDGVRCIVKRDGMWTRNGKKIVSAPHIFEEIAPIFNRMPNLVLDGELYNHDLKHDFNKLISLVKKTKPSQQDLDDSKALVEYHIYDIPSYGCGFSCRLKGLRVLHTLPTEYCKMVDTFHVNNEDELQDKYNDFMELGYEGSMVRTVNSPYENKRSNHLLKMKEFEDAEYEIMGMVEGTGNFTGKCGGMVFKTDNGTEFNAIPNGDWQYLEHLWNNKQDLIGKQATVKYFNLTPDGVPRFPKVIAIRDYD